MIHGMLKGKMRAVPSNRRDKKPKSRPENAVPGKDFAPHAGNIRRFTTPKQWAAWLEKNHAASQGLWIRFFRKDSDTPSITHAQALDEALCWGWIDGQAKPHDEQSWLQRFTPRRPRSAWSKRNRDHVARLEREARMQPSGRAQVDAAKADGRWRQAYDSPANSQVPQDFQRALAKNKKAMAFFKTLNRANLYAIGYRLQTAKKPETRQRRLDRIMQMMEEGKTFH
jgi:uncharacterized protein YdeI (YjbR/CyaY-like superfamily)